MSECASECVCAFEWGRLCRLPPHFSSPACQLVHERFGPTGIPERALVFGTSAHLTLCVLRIFTQRDLAEAKTALSECAGLVGAAPASVHLQGLDIMHDDPSGACVRACVWTAGRGALTVRCVRNCRRTRGVCASALAWPTGGLRPRCCAHGRARPHRPWKVREFAA